MKGRQKKGGRGRGKGERGEYGDKSLTEEENIEIMSNENSFLSQFSILQKKS